MMHCLYSPLFQFALLHFLSRWCTVYINPCFSSLSYTSYQDDALFIFTLVSVLSPTLLIKMMHCLYSPLFQFALLHFLSRWCTVYINPCFSSLSYTSYQDDALFIFTLVSVCSPTLLIKMMHCLYSPLFQFALLHFLSRWCTVYINPCFSSLSYTSYQDDALFILTLVSVCSPTLLIKMMHFLYPPLFQFALLHFLSRWCIVYIHPCFSLLSYSSYQDDALCILTLVSVLSPTLLIKMMHCLYSPLFQFALLQFLSRWCTVYINPCFSSLSYTSYQDDALFIFTLVSVCSPTLLIKMMHCLYSPLFQFSLLHFLSRWCTVYINPCFSSLSYTSYQDDALFIFTLVSVLSPTLLIKMMHCLY